ncbi:MAG: tniQ family protein [Rhodocyclales bacterium]|nr:tniQ family protein [Rhodocyclales bacterium]
MPSSSYGSCSGSASENAVSIKTKSSMLVTPTPYADESASGFMLRLSTVNGLDKCMRELHRFLQISSADVGHMNALQISLLARGESVSVLKRPKGARRPRSTGNMTRVCPLCLAADGYRRLQWDLTYQVACNKHNQLLVTHCSQCGVHLSHQFDGLFVCRCGMDLRELNADAAPAWVHDFHRVFSPWWLDPPSAATARRNAQWDLAMEPIIRLSLRLQTEGAQLSELQRQKRLKPDLWKRIGMMSVSWPTCLQIHGAKLAEMLHSHERRTQITEAPDCPASRSLNELINTISTSKKALRQNRLEPWPGFVTLRTYCRAVNIHSYKGLELFNSGSLAGAVLTGHPTARTHLAWISENEMQAWLAFRARTISIAEAAYILCCTVKLVCALCTRSLLRAVVYEHKPRELRFVVEDVRAFLSSLGRRATVCDVPFFDVIPLLDLKAHAHGSIRPQWTKFWEGIRLQQISLYRPGEHGKGLGDFFVLRSEAKAAGCIPLTRKRSPPSRHNL